MVNPHFLGGLGAALSIFLASSGSCIASVPSGIFAQYARGGINSFFPIIISGVLAIYGCIISVILAYKIQDENMTETQGFMCLSSGLCVGLACLASGAGMAKFVADYIKMNSLKERPSADNNNDMTTSLVSGVNLSSTPLEVSWRFLMVLVFIEAIALYGLIVALLIAG